jgi:hypothetical protein
MKSQGRFRREALDPVLRIFTMSRTGVMEISEKGEH